MRHFTQWFSRHERLWMGVYCLVLLVMAFLSMAILGSWRLSQQAEKVVHRIHNWQISQFPQQLEPSKALIKQGKLPQAITLLTALLEKTPLNSRHSAPGLLHLQIHRQLAGIYTQQGHIQLASKEHETLLKENAGVAEEHALFGQHLNQLGLVQRAEEQLKESLLLNPNDPSTTHALVTIYRSQKRQHDIDALLASYDKALLMTANHDDPDLGIGLWHGKELLGRWKLTALIDGQPHLYKMPMKRLAYTNLTAHLNQTPSDQTPSNNTASNQTFSNQTAWKHKTIDRVTVHLNTTTYCNQLDITRLKLMGMYDYKEHQPNIIIDITDFEGVAVTGLNPQASDQGAGRYDVTNPLVAMDFTLANPPKWSEVDQLQLTITLYKTKRGSLVGNLQTNPSHLPGDPPTSLLTSQ